MEPRDKEGVQSLMRIAANAVLRARQAHYDNNREQTLMWLQRARDRLDSLEYALHELDVDESNRITIVVREEDHGEEERPAVGDSGAQDSGSGSGGPESGDGDSGQRPDPQADDGTPEADAGRES